MLVLVATFSAQLGAASYFVDFSAGADDNAGTSADNPWQRCPGDPAAVDAAAACVLAPGDTVFFKGGVTYVFSGAAGIALKWSGEPGRPIAYDGNSSREWGTGRASFTDNRGANAITAFASAALRRHLAFRFLEIGPIGGAAELPADEGSAVAPRYGGGLAFGGGCESVAIEDCVFCDLGYAFNRRPMNAAAIAGTAFASVGACRDLTITRCDFSRLAVGVDLARATAFSGVQISDSTFREPLLWALNLPANAGSPMESVLTVRDTSFADTTFFGAANWSGHGPDPHTEQVSVSEGSTVTLLASAIAAPAATFLWQKNGQPIEGAVDAALRLANVTPDDKSFSSFSVSAIISSNSDFFNFKSFLRSEKSC